MDIRLRPKCLLVIPKIVDFVQPTILDIDINGIVRHLTRFMDKSNSYVPVFIGYGCAKHEVAVCKELRTQGYKLHHELFMDNFVTTATITNVETYTELMHANSDPRPTLLFSFHDLQQEMLRLHAIYTTTKFIVIGIHAAQTFKLKKELYEYHMFLCTCARLSEQDVVQHLFLNYMHETGMASISSTNKEQCETGLEQSESNTWVYKRSWWDQACDIITCKAATRLLLAED